MTPRGIKEQIMVMQNAIREMLSAMCCSDLEFRQAHLDAAAARLRDIANDIARKEGESDG